MAFVETLIAVIIGLVCLTAIVLLTRKFGKRFVYIVLAGFGIYVLSVDPGIGIAISFIIVMTYLAKKHGDLKKKSV